MLGRIASLLLTYFVGRIMGQADPSGGVVGLSSAMLKKISRMLAIVMVAGLLFWGGFVTVLADLIISHYLVGQLSLTNLSWVGLGLMVVALIGVAVTFTESFWRPVAAQPQPSHNLTDALARLVMDFVDDRQTRRRGPSAERAPGYRDGAAVWERESPQTHVS